MTTSRITKVLHAGLAALGIFLLAAYIDLELQTRTLKDDLESLVSLEPAQQESDWRCDSERLEQMLSNTTTSQSALVVAVHVAAGRENCESSHPSAELGYRALLQVDARKPNAFRPAEILRSTIFRLRGAKHPSEMLKPQVEATRERIRATDQ